LEVKVITLTQLKKRAEMYSDNKNEAELSYTSGTPTAHGPSFEKEGNVRGLVFLFLLQQHPDDCKRLCHQLSS